MMCSKAKNIDGTSKVVVWLENEYYFIPLILDLSL